MTIKSPVLVLNASYEPIAICQARRALTLLVKGTAAVEARQQVVVLKAQRQMAEAQLARAQAAVSRITIKVRPPGS